MPMKKDPLHLDANEQVFFDKALTYVKVKTYDVQHKNLKALELLPVSNEGDPGAEYIEWRSYDAVGVAKIVADYATDFPRVDLFGTAHQAKIQSLGDSFGYSIQEIRRAQMAGYPLDTKKAIAARRGVDEKQDALCWYGDAKAGVQGFFDYPGITEYVVPNGATGSSQSWDSKTADEILNDVVGLITAIPNSTNGKEVPDTLILPLSKYNKLAYTPYGDNRDKTLLTFIRDNYPTITRIDWVSDLSTAGANSGTRMMAYARDPEKVEVQIPVRYEQFPPQQKGAEFEILCHQRTAGVIVYYPMSVAFADGI